VIKAIGRTYHGTSAKILDLGCGNGYVSDQLSRMGHSVTGVDVSRDGIEIAARAYPGVEFRLGSVYDESLNSLGSDFDIVMSLEVVEHLFHPARLFDQARARLKNGGYLILSTPYHGYLKNLAISIVNGWDEHFRVDREGGHIKFFSNAALREMAQAAGLRVLAFDGAGRIPLLWKSTIVIAEK
jgi:2-polyprenyl-3-methyl-5-hydroxy-6-metoxy-1,4-benzoquinol methylase